ncbi:MAG: hypothetical protein H0T62_07760 [Parachlamydiaceae bacterium]|nr:hypothetical protein [Parachlamydiaceae bacterium]
MNIVEKWNNLENGNYFYINQDNNLTASEIKNERGSLVAIFLASTGEIDSLNTVMRTKDLVASALKANERFRVAYDKANIMTKIFWTIAGLFNFSLIGAHQQFINKLASNAAENYEGDLIDLVNKITAKTNPEKKAFYELMAKKVMENIENSPDNTGFLYTITNAKGVTSNLIGTIHLSNYAMTQNQRMIDAVKNSNELYSEVGDSFWFKFNIFNNPFRKLKYSIDLPLINIAREHGKINTALETISEQLMALVKRTIELQEETFRHGSK